MRRSRTRRFTAIAATLAAITLVAACDTGQVQTTEVAARPSTLDGVQSAGVLRCGINTGLPGFAYTDDAGNWVGFDAAYCKAVAAAVLGDANAVEYVNLSAVNRFPALAAGEIDVLSRNTTWTFSRDVDLGFTFAGVSYYDGQGFLAHSSMGITSARQLNGASICIQSGTTTELNLADFTRANNITYEPVPIADNEEARVAYLAGRCDAYTADASALAATKTTFENPADHVVLSEVISKEPLGPLVRQGDDEWADIARWTLNALKNAEELGVTRANVRQLAQGTDNPEINRMLGSEGTLGEMLGLRADWAVDVIAAVGNYGEIFEQYIGTGTSLGFERGLNALYKDGGLQYAPPMR